jgi:adenylate kinase
VEFNKPRHDDVCDIDGLKLFQRDDDKPETIRNRLETYHEKTSPLIDFYDERGILKRFDGSRSPTEVHDHIRATLATLRLEEQI